MAFTKFCIQCGKKYIQPYRLAKFCSRSCSTKYNLSKYWKGKKRPKQTNINNPKWNGGITVGVSDKGYVVLRFNYLKKSIAVHRLMMEEHIGRKLTRAEQVHHINGIKTDNRIENLLLCKDNAEHLRIHKNLRHNAFMQT